MLTPFDHVLALILTLLFPLRAHRMFGKLARASDAELPAVRRGLYRNAMLIQWSLTAVCLALWIGFHRSWRELGVVPVLSGGAMGIMAGLAIVVFVVLRQSAPDAATIEAVKKKTENIARMLPRTEGELRMFYLLSLTAGICEELLYRGYLMWYLQALGLPLIPALGVSAVIFGFGHLYQGPKGMLTTAIVGAFLGGVYVLSGSLIPGMLIHALMDMHSGRLLHHAYTRENEAPALDPA